MKQYRNQREDDAGPAAGLVSSIKQQLKQVDAGQAPLSHHHV